MNLQLSALLAYSLVLVLLGLWIGRTVGTSSKFFIAGRSLGPTLLFSTLLAANIGSGSTVGATGLAYRHGLSAWWWVGSAGIGSLILGLFVGPTLWRIAKRHNLETVGDFLDLRYGPSVRAVVSSLLWLATTTILAAQLIALAWVLNVVADIPKPLGCLLGGLVVTLYFASGGLLASAWVNLTQLVVLLTGFLVAAPLIILKTQEGFSQALRVGSDPDYLNFWQNGESGWPYLALLVPAFIVSPGLIQKLFGAKDEQTVRRAVTVQGFALMLFACLPVILGMAARQLFPDLLNAELALPVLLVESLPPLVGMLGLAAVFSAEISSADAILFMLATSLSKDLYRRFVNPSASDKRVLLVARLSALSSGIIGVLLAIVLPSVIGAMKIFYSILGVALFVPIVAGLFKTRAGSAEALAAVFTGAGVVLGFKILGPSASWMNPQMLALIASLVAFYGLFLYRLARS
jgi:SSS family solute:Na+ symporter